MDDEAEQKSELAITSLSNNDLTTRTKERTHTKHQKSGAMRRRTTSPTQGEPYASWPHDTPITQRLQDGRGQRGP
ncbi:hypothetical protein BC938DRAFT_480383 [Jimgerdemannia flammicorona]|uniref:Uncharacterized protein n=1 Tax=Jimgerdemannia flammicorona TaxID=994334 RepID=A0A433QIM6_9FUNG|nr:hypothetical protein BC938DRAFT_480383 [Jimgerdemannia flammicorona]